MNNLEPLLSAQQLADYLQVPIATIYAWRYRHQGPPGFRVGKHLRFRWADVEDWIGTARPGHLIHRGRQTSGVGH